METMKEKFVSNIHLSKWSAEKISDSICLIDLDELREHEEIRSDYLEQLKNEILSDGILKMPIAVDKETYIILDGHHRLHALKKIGCKKSLLFSLIINRQRSRCILTEKGKWSQKK